MPVDLDIRRVISLGILFAFLANTFGPIPLAQAQEFTLPAPGQMVALSPAFSPVVLKGIKLDPKNPFRFHFFVDRGDSSLSQEELKQESSKLIKYFLASLTIPEKDLWVNLSPYEKDRIVPQEFGQTEMGRDLLAEDYLLKQITASLIYPESQLGKEFWNKVYAQAQAKYGTTNIPINTFNKVWIVPEKAVVYENGGTGFVLENHLKVMLEQDYLSLQKHTADSSGAPQNDVNALGSQIVREIVIPALTKEVNEGKNFSQLRQVFYSLILATWYKKKIKDSILNKVYSNRKKISNLSSPNALVGDPEYIYQQYLKAFKKGVYNYIKEEPDLTTGQTIPRKYFSGGVVGSAIPKVIIYENSTQVNPAQITAINKASIVDIDGDMAMTNQPPNPSADEAMKTAVVDLWNDPKVLQAEQYLKENGFSSLERAPDFDIHTKDKWTDNPVTLPVYALPNGLRIVLKPIKSNERKDAYLLASYRRPGIVPMFFDEDQKDYYYEVDLRSLSSDYRTLYDVLEKDWSRFTEQMRQQVMDVVEDSLRFDKQVWFKHGHLHFGNFMVKVDKQGHLTDIKIIDFKQLRRLSLESEEFKYLTKWMLRKQNNDFENFNFSKLHFLEWFDFKGIKLKGADFRWSELYQCDFKGQDLTDVRLDFAVNEFSRFENVVTQNVQLKSLSQESLQSSVFYPDAKQKLTDGAMNVNDAAQLAELSGILREKYSLDTLQVDVLAQRITGPDVKSETDEEGNEILKTKNGQELVEISSLGTKRFFDDNDKWILTVDRFGNKLEEFQWDKEGKFQRVYIYLVSGKKVFIDKDYEEQKRLTEEHFLGVFSEEEDATILQFNNSNLFDEPESVPTAFGAEHIPSQYKSVGVTILGLLAQLLKDRNKKEHTSKAMRYGGLFPLEYVYTSLKEVATPIKTPYGDDYRGFHFSPSEFLWMPNPPERVFNFKGIPVSVRKISVAGKIKYEITRAYLKDYSNFVYNNTATEEAGHINTHRVNTIVERPDGLFDIYYKSRLICTIDVMGNIKGEIGSSATEDRAMILNSAQVERTKFQLGEILNVFFGSQNQKPDEQDKVQHLEGRYISHDINKTRLFTILTPIPSHDNVHHFRLRSFHFDTNEIGTGNLLGVTRTQIPQARVPAELIQEAPEVTYIHSIEIDLGNNLSMHFKKNFNVDSPKNEKIEITITDGDHSFSKERDIPEREPGFLTATKIISKGMERSTTGSINSDDLIRALSDLAMSTGSAQVDGVMAAEDLSFSSHSFLVTVPEVFKAVNKILETNPKLVAVNILKAIGKDIKKGVEDVSKIEVGQLQKGVQKIHLNSIDDTTMEDPTSKFSPSGGTFIVFNDGSEISLSRYKTEGPSVRFKLDFTLPSSFTEEQRMSWIPRIIQLFQVETKIELVQRPKRRMLDIVKADGAMNAIKDEGQGYRDLFDAWAQGASFRNELINQARQLGFEGINFIKEKPKPLEGDRGLSFHFPLIERYMNLYYIYFNGVRDNLFHYAKGDGVYLYRETKEGYEYMMIDYGPGALDKDKNPVHDLKSIFNWHSYTFPGDLTHGWGLNGVAGYSYLARAISINGNEIRIVEKTSGYKNQAAQSYKTIQENYPFNKKTTGFLVHGFVPFNKISYEGKFSEINEKNILGEIQTIHSVPEKRGSWQLPPAIGLDQIKIGSRVTVTYYQTGERSGNLITQKVINNDSGVSDTRLSFKVWPNTVSDYFSLSDGTVGRVSEIKEFKMQGESLLDLSEELNTGLSGRIEERKIPLGTPIEISYRPSLIIDKQLKLTGEVVEIPSNTNQGILKIRDLLGKERVISRAAIKEFVEETNSMSQLPEKQQLELADGTTKVAILDNIHGMDLDSVMQQIREINDGGSSDNYQLNPETTRLMQISLSGTDPNLKYALAIDTHNNKVIGYAFFDMTMHFSRAIHVSYIAVHPENQRLHIGIQLMRHIFEYAFKAGLPVQLFTDQSSKNLALAFYDKLPINIPGVNVSKLIYEGLLEYTFTYNPDSAMNGAKQKILTSDPGGINLNPTQMNIQVKKEGDDFKFDFNGTEIDAAQVTGATFTIRSMLPVTNLPEILGLSQEITSLHS